MNGVCVGEPGGQMTRNRLLCIGVLIVTFSFVFFSGGKVPYLFLYAILSVIVVSVAHALVAAKTCIVSYQLDSESIVKGDVLTLSLVVENRGWFFVPYVFIKDKKMKAFDILEHVTVFSVAPWATEKIKIGIVGKYRGLHDLGLCELSAMDFLGIVTVKLPIRVVPKAVVYPRLEHLEVFEALDRMVSGTKAAIDRLEEDLLAISDIRNYIEGDSTKRIHWKASARMQSLMSKNYEDRTNTKLNFVLDLSSQVEDPDIRLAVEDKTIEAAIALAYYVLGKHCEISLRFSGSENMVDDIVENMVGLYFNENMFETLYRVLAVVEFSSAKSSMALLDNLEMETDGSVDALVVTCNLTELLVRKINDLVERGYAMILVHVHYGQLSEADNELLKRIQAAAVICRSISVGAKLHEVLC